MTTPGVEVRPLRQINGVAHFNEVFLTDVRIPADGLVGEVNNGWRVAQTTLGSERALIAGGAGLAFADLARLASRTGRAGDAVRRQELARAFTRMELVRYLGLRAQTAASHGTAPGPEVSVLKLAYSQHVAATGDLVLALVGAAGMLLHDDAPDGGVWQEIFMGQWSTRIGGGTDEVQRNVIGERALGLAREPRLDQDVGAGRDDVERRSQTS
jgi:alkylation response protein AidB-like acyl-CoA dehydrogenase